MSSWGRDNEGATEKLSRDLVSPTTTLQSGLTTFRVFRIFSSLLRSLRNGYFGAICATRVTGITTARRRNNNRRQTP